MGHHVPSLFTQQLCYVRYSLSLGYFFVYLDYPFYHWYNSDSTQCFCDFSYMVRDKFDKENVLYILFSANLLHMSLHEHPP